MNGEQEAFGGAHEGAVYRGDGFPGFPDAGEKRGEVLYAVVQTVFPEVGQPVPGFATDWGGGAAVYNEFHKHFFGHEGEDDAGDEGEKLLVHSGEGGYFFAHVDEHVEEVDFGHGVAFAQDGFGGEVEGDFGLVAATEAVHEGVQAARKSREAIRSCNGWVQGDGTTELFKGGLEGLDAGQFDGAVVAVEFREYIFEDTGFLGVEENNFFHGSYISGRFEHRWLGENEKAPGFRGLTLFKLFELRNGLFWLLRASFCANIGRNGENVHWGGCGARLER